MTKWFLAACAAALVGVAGVALAADDAPGIGEVMKKLYKGKGAIHNKIGDQLKSDAVPWEEIQAETKDYVKFGELLTKAKPEVGLQASWDKLTAAYAAETKKLAEAAAGKDLAAATAAHGKLQKSCKACHDAHRE